MFESAELGHRISKEIYKKEVPELREALLDVQLDLAERRPCPVIILIGGVDGSGKGETANLLNEWMDPRHISTYAFGPETEEEAARPHMWRFWRELPPKGEIAIFFGSWYSSPIIQRAYGRIKKADLDNAIEHIVRFERMLTDEGVLLIKLWFHLSKEKQTSRIHALQKNPKTRWRVTQTDLHHLKLYQKFRNLSGHILRETNTANAPWIVIEGYDANYRNLTTGRYIYDSIRKQLANGEKVMRKAAAAPILKPMDHLHILNTLDLSKTLDKPAYVKALEKYQGKFNLLTRHERFKETSLVIVFEGADAAGKGGSIRRITQAVDARFCNVVPTAMPTEEERAQPYLWRFWRHVPRNGHITIYDRSWYGRVLVERVEGLCSEQDWMRAYAEINDFEVELIDHGSLVVKFWLQISQEDQLKRFQERQNIPFKRFKITEEDWRNREKWDDYQHAVSDMVERTSTGHAPWILVEANDKYHARIKILQTLCDALEDKLRKMD
jgi:AMP-polyphosphate phosphotransferase